MWTSVSGSFASERRSDADLRRRLREVGVQLELAQRPVVVEDDGARLRLAEAPLELLLQGVVDGRRPLGARGHVASSGRAG